MMKSLKVRFWQSLLALIFGLNLVQQPLLLLVDAFPAKHDRNMANIDGDSKVQQAKASSAVPIFVYGLAFLVFALILVVIVKSVHQYVSGTKDDVDLKAMTEQLQKSMIKKKNSVSKSSRQFYREFTQPLSTGNLTSTSTTGSSTQQTSSWIGEDSSTTSTVPFSSNTSQKKVSVSPSSENQTTSDSTAEHQSFDSKKTAPRSSDDNDSIIYMSKSSVIINKSGSKSTSLKKNDAVVSLNVSQIKVFSAGKNAKELVKESATDKRLKVEFDIKVKEGANENEEAKNKQSSTLSSSFQDDNSKSVYSQKPNMYPTKVLKPVSILRKTPYNHSTLTDTSLSDDVSIDEQQTPSSFSIDSTTSKEESSKVVVHFGKHPLAKVEKKNVQTKSVSFSRALNVRFYEK